MARSQCFSFLNPKFVSRLSSVIVAVLMFLFTLPVWRVAYAQQSIPNDPQGGCPVAANTFAGWFETGTPAANGIVKPADSVNFPNLPNCSFYEWSKQMFLWLTSPAPSRYGGGTRIFNSPTFYDVSPPDANGFRTLSQHKPGLLKFFRVRAAKPGPDGLPVVFDRRGRMFEVEKPKLGPTGKPIVLNRLNHPVEVGQVRVENNKAVFLDKTGKPIRAAKPQMRKQPAVTIQRRRRPTQKTAQAPIAQRFIIDRRAIFFDLAGNVIDTEEGQAGTDAVLMSQNHSLAYFATMVNDVYAYFLTGNKDGMFNPAFTQFPVSASDLGKITSFASAHSKTFPDPNALTVEVKTAWVEASGLPNASEFITLRATVPTYDTSNPANWAPNGQKTTTLALVSIHVVGSTAGHPEMIWATFEHLGSTPSAAYSYNSTTAGGVKSVAQDTSGTWLFSTSNSAGPFNCERMNEDASGHIVAFAANGNCPPAPAMVGPSDTLRQNPFGKAGTDANSNTEVIAINSTTLIPGNDLRNSYFLSGATWTIGGAPPSSQNQVGTNILANSALETYTQAANCFSCHSGSNMLGTSSGNGLSHIYGPLKSLF
ncbi:MAG: hypothetical protein ACJ72H_29360 [Candidatus Sulfotelmatobacter sp.]|jgi:hypothetical protein